MRSERGRSGMKSPLALIAIVLLSVGVVACGSSSSGTQSGPSGAGATSARTEPPADDAVDGDFLTPPDRNDDGEIQEYGHAAGPAVKRTVTALARRFMEAGLAADGATACSLINSPLAKSIPEVYTRPGNPPYMLGKTCAEVMSNFFRHLHGELATEVAGLEVTGIRTKGDRAYALFAFRNMPERRYLSMERKNGVWKITELIDGKFP